MPTLYPRLVGIAARDRIDTVRLASPDNLPDQRPTDLPLEAFVFSPSGGRRVEPRELNDLREELMAVAREQGFPERPSRARAQRFDARAGVVLVNAMDLTASEASRPGLWPFLACELVPDLVRWRFPGMKEQGTARERFADGVRNAVGRLWWRTRVLGGHDGNEEVLAELGEDELVQLMERPILRADFPLARLMARVLIDTGREHPELPRSEIMRDAQKRVLRMMPLTGFEALEQERRTGIVEEVFRQSARVLSEARS